MADGTVRVNFAADVSDVRKGSRDVIKEIDKVNRAADKSASNAARSSSKALSGVLRLIQTGEVSSKKLDKIGKSASGLLSGLSSVGVGLGLGALPLASDLAVAAIKRIQKANESLTDRINQSATAMRQANVAQRASAGGIDAITAADLSAADAHKALNDARRDGNKTASEMTRLELAASAADRDAATAREASRNAIIEARKASDKYAGSVQSVIDKSLKLTDATQSGRAMILDTAASVDTVVSALRNHAQAAEGLTNAERGAERALADYIQTTGEVPKDIKTVLALLGQGKSIAEIRTFLGLTDKIPPKKTTKVNVTGADQAAAKLRIMKGYLDGLHNKTIDVTTRHFNRGEAPGSATGSMIGGRFDGKDNIPVMVSKGEAILNPRQISLVNRGMSVQGALGATGGKTIHAGGGYAKGGRPDRDMDTFLGGSILDRLALAASTLTESDDRSAAGVARDRIDRILKSGKLGKRKLTRTERRMLLEALGGYRRDALSPDTAAGDVGGGGGGVGSIDPFELERARQGGVASGLGRAAAYVFGGSGDIGSGGSNALMAAGSVHFENVSFTNSVQNTTAFAKAANVGNDVQNGGKIRSTRQGVAF